MQSSKWGPPLWDSLFHIAAGYDFNDTPKREKDRQYRAFFGSLGDVLPCRYCRDSYRNFYAALDIDRYMTMPSCGLTKYVYDLKNLVSNKLASQENKALREKFIELTEKHAGQDTDEFWDELRREAHHICYTKPAPPFGDVLEDLKKHRAGCSQKMKTCRAPLGQHMTDTPVRDFSDADDIRLYRRDAAKWLGKENLDGQGQPQGGGGRR